MKKSVTERTTRACGSRQALQPGLARRTALRPARQIFFVKASSRRLPNADGTERARCAASVRNSIPCRKPRTGRVAPQHGATTIRATMTIVHKETGIDFVHAATACADGVVEIHLCRKGKQKTAFFPQTIEKTCRTLDKGGSLIIYLHRSSII